MPTHKRLEELALLGSDALAPLAELERAPRLLSLPSEHQRALLDLLEIKNGFYAFDSALHVFPFTTTGYDGQQDLLRWNAPDLWKDAYGPEARELFSFAEDIFGDQFCFLNKRIVRFDPETGENEDLCATLGEWAGLVVSDRDFQAGYPFARDWQAAHGPLRAGNRLVPIYPFVTREGRYDLSNLYETNALTGMLSRSDFARQIKSIPDGTKVRIVTKW